MIEFVSLSARFFRSWKRLDIDLSDQGVVCMKGETGAGKSSIFSALMWGLYGSTPEATKADEIRNPRKSTAVRIVLRREDQEYIITRYRGHKEYKNKVFFTGHGIPLVVEDSYVRTVQGLINSFLGVSETIFLTTTYFAQRNFHHFHSLTDTQKKAFIESITYGSLFEACERIVREKVARNQRDIDKLEGEIKGLEESIKNIQVQTEEQKQQLKEEAQIFRQKIEYIDQHLVKLNIDLKKYEHFVDEHEKLNDEIWSIDNTINDLKEDIERYERNTGPCPRCGLIMLDNLKRGRIYEAQESIKKLEMKHDRLTEKYKKVGLGYQKYTSTEKWIKEKERDRILLQSEIDHRRSQYSRRDNTEELRKMRDELQEEVSTLKKEVTYSSFWIKGFGWNGLRAYVLINAIRYLSGKIELYLRRVMGEKIDFQLLLENNRLVTDCNGRSYNSLSGGERQAVDLCTGLAMRDLAEQYNKSHFNILIVDEGFEGLDKNLTAVAQSLVLEYAKPSTFLITHQDFSGNFDQLYHVSKVHNHSQLRKVY